MTSIQSDLSIRNIKIVNDYVSITLCRYGEVCCFLISGEVKKTIPAQTKTLITSALPVKYGWVDIHIPYSMDQIMLAEIIDNSMWLKPTADIPVGAWIYGSFTVI